MENYETRIDPAACIGCGICIPLCPVDALSMEGELAVRSGDCTLGCGHCAASCPEDAITVPVIDPDALTLRTVSWDRI